MYNSPQAQTIETKVAILEEKIHTTDQLMQRIDSAIEKLSEVNANVTKMLIVHEEKINNNVINDNINNNNNSCNHPFVIGSYDANSFFNHYKELVNK